MSFIVYVFLISCIYTAYRKPYMTGMFMSLIFSFSPFIQLFIANSQIHFTVILLFIILLWRAFKDKMINWKVIGFISLALIFITIQYLANSVPLAKVTLNLMRFILIPLTAYFTIQYIRNLGKKLSSVYFAYFVVNLMVVYYRVLVDYSFFNVINNYRHTILEATFKFGGVNYRPSNLSSAIIFSIELVLFIFLLFYEKQDKRTILAFTLFSVFPFIMMMSRSAFILAILLVFYYLVKNREYKKLMWIFGIVVIAVIALGSKIRFLSVLDLEGSQYTTRIASMFDTVAEYFKEGIGVILLGKGVGTSNTRINPGEAQAIFEVYVENFNIALLYDTGIFVFVFWIFFNIKLFIKSLKFREKSSYLFFAAIALTLLNNLASNMSSYFIQLLFWQIVFMAYTEYDSAKEHIDSSMPQDFEISSTK